MSGTAVPASQLDLPIARSIPRSLERDALRRGGRKQRREPGSQCPCDAKIAHAHDVRKRRGISIPARSAAFGRRRVRGTSFRWRGLGRRCARRRGVGHRAPGRRRIGRRLIHGRRHRAHPHAPRNASHRCGAQLLPQPENFFLQLAHAWARCATSHDGTSSRRRRVCKAPTRNRRAPGRARAGSTLRGWRRLFLLITFVAFAEARHTAARKFRAAVVTAA